jgi:hypothetical protein
MRKRLERFCGQNELSYRIHSGVWAALCSHARWLKLMGTPPATVTDR